MSFDFKLPDIGEGIAEGEIIKWLVREGDQVQEDQAILEVMTDKATVEISAPQAAKVEKIHVKEGSVVPVGEILISFSGAKEGAAVSEERSEEKKAPKAEPTRTPSPQAPQAQAATAPQTAAPQPKPQPMPADPTGRILASPATRRLAREMGVDISRIQGSGPGGRVTREDLIHGTGATQAGAPIAYVPKETVSKSPKTVSKRPEFGRRAPGARKTGVEVVPLRGIRKTIAERMTQSKRQAAHFTHVDEVDMTELIELRKNAKELAAEKGVRLSYLPFIIRAIAMGLKEFPSLNATIDQEKKEITYKYYYNVGVAVATDSGDLMVPVIKNADQKTILELAGEIQAIAEKARTGKLSMEDLKDGTFTLTSMGNLGGLFATPIINYPEVAILGFHQIKETPVVRDGEIVIRSMAHFSISLDHRLVDGAVGASFLNEVIRYLESPSLMLLNA